MKKVLSVLVLMIMSFALLLSGCGTSLVMPATNAGVKGNGGFVVQKGEYIYFANAYTGYSSLESDVTSTDTEYAIYRVKVSDFTNGRITYDENGYPENVQKIVSKISGFENSGLYIVGDYLYFASPNLHKTNRNENRFDLVTIFSVKLDGSSLKELYTTADYTSGDWTVLQVDGKAYLITRENTNLIRHELKYGSISNKTVLSDEVVSSVLVDEVTSDFDKSIYYTTGRTTEETELGFSGNILKKVNIATGAVTSDNNPFGVSITLLSQQHGKLFYTSTATNSVAKLYVKSISGADTKLTDWTDATSLMFFGYENDNSPKDIVYISQEKLVAQSFDSAAVTVLVNSVVTPLFTSGDVVYYSTSTNISRYDYKQSQAQVVTEDDYQSGMVDFDGRYLYVFVQLSGTDSSIQYLHRIDTYALELGNTPTTQLVGYVDEAARPTEE